MSVDKRTIAGILVVLLAVVATVCTSGCIFQDTGTDTKDLPLANNGSWYNYDITNAPAFSTLQHTYDPKENFYAYANAEQIRKLSKQDFMTFLTYLIGMGSSSQAEEILKTLMAQFDEISRDSSLSGTEAELVKTMHALYSDTATRDKLGVTPVLPAVEEIRNVSTLDELTALISSGGLSSLKETFVREVATGSLMDGSVTTLEISPGEFALINTTLYSDMTPENARLYAHLMQNFHTFLVRCGYTPDEADATVSAFQSFERSLAPACGDMASADPRTVDYLQYCNPYTYDQFSQMAFPIAGDLKDYHDAGVTRYSVLYPSWLERLNELYTPEHIEEFKAAMLYTLFMSATPFLDTELEGMYFDYQIQMVYPILENILGEVMASMVQTMGNLLGGVLSLFGNESTGSMDSSVSTASLLSSANVSMSADDLLPLVAGTMAKQRVTEEYLGMALGKVITDKQVPAGEKEKYTELTQAVLDAFRNRLVNASWLSESTRAAALDKLSKVKIRVLYPDDWSYYSYDDVDYRDAGTLYNLSVQLRKHNQAEVVKDALQAPSASVWIKDPNHQYYLIPQVYNAFYNPTDNSINILYGYVSGLIDNPDTSYEEILAVAGTTIAHEIIHGFDPTGSLFDGDGTYVNWWTDSDRQNFNEKEQKIAEYYSRFEARPGDYLNGGILTGEAIADFGGLSVALDMARTVEDFDYDEFFTAYAKDLYQPTMNALYDVYLTDVHQPGMYRVNVGVQQYDEFLGTYNVSEGNLMYLAPEDRLTIW